MKETPVQLPEEARAELKRLAKQKGLSMSAYIRVIVMEHLREKKNETS